MDAGGFYVENEAISRVQIFTDLGFSVPAEFTNLAGELITYAEVSAEQLDLMDRDVVVWDIGLGGGRRNAIESSPLFAGMAATREGRHVFVEEDVLAVATNSVSVLSVPLVLDQLVPRLAAAIDGDPETSTEPGA